MKRARGQSVVQLERSFSFKMVHQALEIIGNGFQSIQLSSSMEKQIKQKVAKYRKSPLPEEDQSYIKSDKATEITFVKTNLLANTKQELLLLCRRKFIYSVSLRDSKRKISDILKKKMTRDLETVNLATKEPGDTKKHSKFKGNITSTGTSLPLKRKSSKILDEESQSKQVKYDGHQTYFKEQNLPQTSFVDELRKMDDPSTSRLNLSLLKLLEVISIQDDDLKIEKLKDQTLMYIVCFKDHKHLS